VHDRIDIVSRALVDGPDLVPAAGGLDVARVCGAAEVEFEAHEAAVMLELGVDKTGVRWSYMLSQSIDCEN